MFIKGNHPWNKGKMGMIGRIQTTEEKTKRKNTLRGMKHLLWNWRGGKIEKHCLVCNDKFYVIPSRLKVGKFCSRKCFGIYKKGKNNTNWKGGTTSLWRLIRELPESIIWRNEVFKRDNYTCQKCFVSNGNLEAHHKKPFFLILKEFIMEYSQFSPLEDKEILVRLALSYYPFWDTTNGLSLCEECHNLIGHKLVRAIK